MILAKNPRNIFAWKLRYLMELFSVLWFDVKVISGRCTMKSTDPKILPTMKSVTVEASDWFDPPEVGSPTFDCLSRLFIEPNSEKIISIYHDDMVAMVDNPAHELRCNLYKLRGDALLVNSSLKSLLPKEDNFKLLVKMVFPNNVNLGMLYPFTDTIFSHCGSGNGFTIFGVDCNDELLGDQVQMYALVTAQI